MKHAATETIRTAALFVIAAFPTLALIASYPAHAQAPDATAPAASSVAAAAAALPLAAAPAGAVATDSGRADSEGGSRRERRCEHTRRIGKVTHTRCQ